MTLSLLTLFIPLPIMTPFLLTRLIPLLSLLSPSLPFLLLSFPCSLPPYPSYSPPSPALSLLTLLTPLPPLPPCLASFSSLDPPLEARHASSLTPCSGFGGHKAT